MTDDVAPADATAAAVPAALADLAGADRSLLGLVDRLAALLERSELTELEVEAGGTGLVLRKPSALRSGGPAAESGLGAKGFLPKSRLGRPPTVLHTLPQMLRQAGKAPQPGGAGSPHCPRRGGCRAFNGRRRRTAWKDDASDA